MPDRNDLPAPTEGLVLTHFLTVRDVARSRDFYADIFGGQVVLEENPAIVKIADHDRYPSGADDHAGSGAAGAGRQVFPVVVPIWERDMSPPWRRQHRRRTGRPNYRLVRYADDFVVLVHGTKSDAEALRAEIGELLGRELTMTLSVEKTHITHIDDGFVFLGFRIQRRRRGDGRRVVLTIPSKQALAGVMHKIKQATKTGTSLRLGQALRKINPILRGWAAYFRYGASRQTFAYLGWYAWWRMIYWIRRKHPHLTWKQIRRRYYGADRIREDKLVLYNPAKMRVERYRYRGAQITTPFNIDVIDPAGARFRRTGHDDVEFVGQVSELLT